MAKPNIAVFTGAGISAESGLATFRASDGLWENHRVEDVASPEGWQRNPGLVLDFYNQRRRQARSAMPNAAHIGIFELEKHFEVSVITQNVDDLHERAGSTSVIHLHGSLFQARGTGRNQKVIDWYEDMLPGNLAEDGSQLRPHIVWFGEAVPMMDTAIHKVMNSEALLIVGTSLQVYPAASLLGYLPAGLPVLYLDPNPAAALGRRVEVFAELATAGIGEVSRRLMELFSIPD